MKKINSCRAVSKVPIWHFGTSTAKISNHNKKYVASKKDTIENQYKKLKEINTSSTIEYKNIVSGMSLEYVVSANDVKENIIISDMMSPNTFSFLYELHGLSAEMCEDGSICLYDPHAYEVIYILPPPYMYDAEGTQSNDVYYEVTNRINIM